MILGTFDPTCVGKSVLKKLKGKNDAYYLYRVRDTPASASRSTTVD